MDNIFNQFYKLENYILNITHYLNNDINDYELKLKKTSNFLSLVNDLSYDKIIGYHSILDELIEKKYEIIFKKEKYEKKEEEGDDDDDFSPNRIEKASNEFIRKFKDALDKTKNLFTKAFEILENDISIIEDNLKITFEEKTDDKDDDVYILDLISEIINILEDFKNKEIHSGKGKEFNLNKKEIKVPAIIIFFVPFPYLQMRIIPSLSADLYFKLNYELDFKKNDYSVFFELSGKAEVNLYLEVGCYIPSYPSGVETAVKVGIKGTLGSGALGLKLSIFINKPEYSIETTFEFYLMKFTFYILFEVKIDLKIFSFSFEFYLIKKDLNDGIGYKKRKKESYKLPKFIFYS